MPKVRYGVAMSLDGFIAGPHGEFDWITPDPEIDFAKIWEQFDLFLMGRRTFEVARTRLHDLFRGKRLFVASRTLRPEDFPDLTVIPELTTQHMQHMRAEAKKDIWLFGGADLCSTLMNLGEVDIVELTVCPVLLGDGVPLTQPLAQRSTLELQSHHICRSGLIRLAYTVRKDQSLQH